MGGEVVTRPGPRQEPSRPAWDMGSLGDKLTRIPDLTASLVSINEAAAVCAHTALSSLAEAIASCSFVVCGAAL